MILQIFLEMCPIIIDGIIRQDKLRQCWTMGVHRHTLNILKHRVALSDNAADLALSKTHHRLRDPYRFPVARLHHKLLLRLLQLSPTLRGMMILTGRLDRSTGTVGNAAILGPRSA